MTETLAMQLRKQGGRLMDTRHGARGTSMSLSPLFDRSLAFSSRVSVMHLRYKGLLHCKTKKKKKRFSLKRSYFISSPP